jgi:hypothetical protein
MSAERPPSGLRLALEAIAANPLPALAVLFAGVVLGAFTANATVGGAETPVSERAPDLEQADSGAADQRDRRERRAPAGAPEDEGDARPAQRRGVAAALDAVDAYQQELGGGVEVGAAIVRLDGSREGRAGGLDTLYAWSAMKVPATAAYFNFLRSQSGGASGSEALSGARGAGLDMSLVESTNEGIRAAVKEMVQKLGAAPAAQAIQDLLAGAGVQVTISDKPDPTLDGSLAIGQTEWTLAQAADFYAEFYNGCLEVAAADRAWILERLRQAPGALEWGAGTVYPHERIAYKPGWGAGPRGFEAQQVVVVGTGGPPSFHASPDAYVLAIGVREPGGSLEAAQPHLAELARRVEASMSVPDGPDEPPACQ